jgi:transcriptional regulator with XRE-family HTH domain
MPRPKKPRTLAEWCTATHTTQAELAKRVGVAQSRVHSWLSGSYPPVKHWTALRKVTGLPITAFMPPDVAAELGGRA